MQHAIPNLRSNSSLPLTTKVVALAAIPAIEGRKEERLTELAASRYPRTKSMRARTVAEDVKMLKTLSHLASKTVLKRTRMAQQRTKCLSMMVRQDLK